MTDRRVFTEQDIISSSLIVAFYQDDDIHIFLNYESSDLNMCSPLACLSPLDVVVF